jgi:ABC-type phosphate transport system permease subunit
MSTRDTNAGTSGVSRLVNAPGAQSDLKFLTPYEIVSSQRGPITQAILDTLAITCICVFLCCTALSVPVALFLMFFASF